MLLRGYTATLVRIKKVYCVLFMTAAVRTTKAQEMGKCVECHLSRMAVKTQRERHRERDVEGERECFLCCSSLLVSCLSVTVYLPPPYHM